MVVGGRTCGGGAGVGIGRKARLIARQATRTIEEHASKETRDSTASTRLSSYELSYSKGGSCFVPHARWASNTDDVVDMPREEHMHHQTPFDLKDGSRRKKSGIGAYIAKGARLCWPGESNTQEVSKEARKKHLLEKMFSCTRSTKPLTCAARSAASRTSAHGILAPRIAPTSTCASAGPRPTQRENTATCISTTEDPISANRASG